MGLLLTDYIGWYAALPVTALLLSLYVLLCSVGLLLGLECCAVVTGLLLSL